MIRTNLLLKGPCSWLVCARQMRRLTRDLPCSPRSRIPGPRCPGGLANALTCLTFSAGARLRPGPLAGRVHRLCQCFFKFVLRNTHTKTPDTLWFNRDSAHRVCPVFTLNAPGSSRPRHAHCFLIKSLSLSLSAPCGANQRALKGRPTRTPPCYDVMGRCRARIWSRHRNNHIMIVTAVTCFVSRME